MLWHLISTIKIINKLPKQRWNWNWLWTKIHTIARLTSSEPLLSVLPAPCYCRLTSSQFDPLICVKAHRWAATLLPHLAATHKISYSMWSCFSKPIIIFVEQNYRFLWCWHFEHVLACCALSYFVSATRCLNSRHRTIESKIYFTRNHKTVAAKLYCLLLNYK